MVAPMTKTPAIAVRGLVKRYGAIRAADGVDLTIEAGQIYALLGPNGAGKTTTVEILEGFRRRDEGDVQVLGMDPGKGSLAYRTRIGIAFQNSATQELLSAREVLAFQRGAVPTRRCRPRRRWSWSGCRRRRISGPGS